VIQTGERPSAATSTMPTASRVSRFTALLSQLPGDRRKDDQQQAETNERMRAVEVQLTGDKKFAHGAAPLFLDGLRELRAREFRIAITPPRHQRAVARPALPQGDAIDAPIALDLASAQITLGKARRPIAGILQRGRRLRIL
jgi:hypothetical protein